MATRMKFPHMIRIASCYICCIISFILTYLLFISIFVLKALSPLAGQSRHGLKFIKPLNRNRQSLKQKASLSVIADMTSYILLTYLNNIIPNR